MPIQNWSDQIIVVELADDPAFSDEMTVLSEMLAERQAHVVMNLAEVSFLNSSNIAKLLRLRKQMTGSSRRLILCSIGNLVWSEFTVTGLDKIFEFSNDITTALATLQLDGNSGAKNHKGKNKQ
jgi:anti-anti-sigma factor